MMQHDEQRVIDALRAFTGGLIVTDQEISTAETRLRDRLEPPSPRRRLVVLAAAVAAVLVAGFFITQAIDGREDSAPPAHTPSSPADSLTEALQADAYGLSDEEFIAGAAPSRQDMAGFWILREPYFFTMFVNADGDWILGTPSARAGFGPSSLTGNTWVRHHDDDGICAKSNDLHGYSQSWQAALAADGSLHLLLGAGPSECTPAASREVWDRIVPGSPLATYLVAATDGAEWQEAPRSFGWRGVYVAPSTGHVLDVTDDEKFRVYDPVNDVSLVAVDEGEIRYDSVEQQSSGTCTGATFSASAEVTQLPAVTGYLGSLEAVRVSTSENCASGFTSDEVWVKVA